MSQSPDHDDGSQRSVAELIARYGGSSPSGGRRHRRATDVDETATHPVGGRGASSAEPAAPSQRTGRRRAPEPADAPPIAATPVEAPPAGARPVATPQAETSLRPSRTATYRSSQTSYSPAGGDLFTAWGDDDGSRTEQLPRIGPGPVLSPSPAPMPPRPRGPHRGEPPAGLNGSQPAADAPDRRGSTVQRLRAVPPIEDEPRSDQVGTEEAVGGTGGSTGAETPYDGGHTGDDEQVSAFREWAVVAAQVGGGVIGGAVLWLACEWLWQSIPVLALIVALAVITGLVWVVRRVRRAEDLQTTVVAVLVGLFVTVSPAALLLVGR